MSESRLYLTVSESPKSSSGSQIPNSRERDEDGFISKNTLIISSEAKQRRKEEILIESVNLCSESELEIIKINFHGLDEKILGNYLKELFYNQDVMEFAECIISSLSYISPSDSGSISLNDKIITYITNLRKIDKLSSQGNVFLADLCEAEDLFLIKSPLDPKKDFLLHELVIGLHGTNKLRRFVPNFTYIYSGFKGSPPLFNPKSKKVLSWCEGGNDEVNYVVSENISASISLNEYIKNCNDKDFLNIYMQILYALKKAHSLIDFTHYNINGNNIIIRSVDLEEFQIPYETEKSQIEYIQSSVIATIVNYEYSHIKIPEIVNSKGKIIPSGDYGKFGLKDYSVYPNKSFPIHDLYKLLMASMKAAYDYENQPVLETGQIIYSFFSDGLFTEDIVKEDNLKIPSELISEDIDQSLIFDKLANYIRNNLNCDFISEEAILPTLSCKTLSCDFKGDIYDDVGVEEAGNLSIPGNILDFVILLYRIENNKCKADKLLSLFNYGDNIKKGMRILKKLIEEVILEVEQTIQGDIMLINTIGLEYIKEVKLMYFQLSIIFLKLRKIKILYEICIKSMKAYDDTSRSKIVTSLIGKLIQSIDSELKNFITIVDRNKEFTVIDYSNEDFLWFDKDRVSFDVVIGKGYTRYIELEEEYFLLK